VREWQEKHGFPFELYTEASVDLATKPELVDSMVASGFSSVFLGIETPSAASLKETHKLQNLRQPSDEAVRLITAAGLEVYAGFIVGFDSDGPEIFEAQRSFISSLPIPVAMIGILTALPGTQLTRRLHKEGRLRIVSATGDQFDRPNFEPAMDERTLLSGYGELLADLYSPKAYYDRCVRLVTTVGKPKVHTRLRAGALQVLARSIWTLGVLSPRRLQFWRLFATALLRAPHAAARAIELAIQGEHLIRYTQEDVLPRLQRALESLPRESAPKAQAKLERPVAAEA
jgi:Domain of unknown function (DUF4070)